MSAKPIAIRLDPELLAALDSDRGGVSRTDWIRAAIQEKLVGGARGLLESTVGTDPSGADRKARTVETTKGGGAVSRSGRNLMDDLRASTGLSDDEAVKAFNPRGRR